MSNQWYAKRWVSVSLHVLFWALLFSYPFLVRSIFENNNAPSKPTNHSGIIYLLFFNNVLRMLLFYANAYFFIPRLAYQKKFMRYVLALLLSWVVLFLCDRFLFFLFLSGASYYVWNFFIFNLPFVFFIVVVSTAFRLIWDRVEANRRTKEQETENLKTELSFLRSQVSPHFMFNVLNNMVALARKKSDVLEPSLIKLSQLLRYMLYETNEDKVLLEKELSYLQSFIDLQKQRFGKNLQIQTDFRLQESGHTIEPMLLIPFVENAFKHGTGLLPNAEIDIHLQVEQGRLLFSVRNRYSDERLELKDKTSGIGLTNVKRRLNLLYAGNHTLSIVKEGGWFLVTLQLNLH